MLKRHYKQSFVGLKDYQSVVIALEFETDPGNIMC